MGTKYPGVNIANYNATPPSDDGQQIASNEIAWDKHKTKLGDPIKTLAEAMNTALLAHTDESVRNTAVNSTAVAADHKRTINVNGAATISIDDSANLPAGFIVFVRNEHTASITVDLVQATDTLDGVVAGTYTVLPGDTVEFISNAAGDGFLSMSSAVSSPETFNYITKAATQNSTTAVLADDNDLQFTADANGIYQIEWWLLITSASSTPDFKFQWIEPDGTFQGNGEQDSTNLYFINEASAALNKNIIGGAVSILRGNIIYSAGVTGGLFKLQWAQNTTDGANPTQVLAGSTMRYRKLN